jgi:hypothetical protein
MWLVLVRKMKEGEVTADLFGFLTTAPNNVVRAIHPKAMPVVLTAEDEVEQWLSALSKRRFSFSARFRTNAHDCGTRGKGGWPGGVATRIEHQASLE